MPIRDWLLCAALLPLPSAQPAGALTPTAADALLVTGARVLNPAGTDWLADRAVLIVDGRIVAVAPLADLDVPTGARALDLEGLFLVPGLIDLHTHLVLYPYDQTSWNDQVLKESLELRTIRAVGAARATLEAGFTTIRELGTEGAGFVDAALRDAVAAQIVPGPRILATTRALVATGCYGPAGFDPRWDVPKGGQVADGPDGVRVAVREQLAAGADWIKIYADYRRRPGHPATPTFSIEELRAIVDECRSAGVPVAAHATTDAAIRRSVEAGVDTIEHGYGVSPETLALMVRRGVALCPTLAANEAITRYRGWKPGQPEPERLHTARTMFKHALRSSVKIACGSDAGVFAHGDNARELELMVDYGMSTADALRSATAVAAGVLGRDDLGRIAPGHVADLVAFGRDPLERIANLREPLVVVQGGRIAVDRRPTARTGAEARAVDLCRRFLEALSASRFDEMTALLAPDAVVAYDLQVEGRRATAPAAAFIEHTRQRGSTLREWIAGKPTVHVDGGIATVWARFLLVEGGEWSTGVDAFQLVELEDGWRIVSLSFTNRPF